MVNTSKHHTSNSYNSTFVPTTFFNTIIFNLKICIVFVFNCIVSTFNKKWFKINTSSTNVYGFFLTSTFIVLRSKTCLRAKMFSRFKNIHINTYFSYSINCRIFSKTWASTDMINLLFIRFS